MGIQIYFVSRNGDAIYPALEEMCEYLGVEYISRAYDSTIYSSDREYIERLPAFHIYENHHHIKTLYPGPDILEVERFVYNARKKQAKRKSKSWKQFIRKVGSLLR